MNLESPGQFGRLPGFEGLVQDSLPVGKVDISQILQHLGGVPSGPAVCGLDMSPSFEGNMNRLAVPCWKRYPGLLLRGPDGGTQAQTKSAFFPGGMTRHFPRQGFRPFPSMPAAPLPPTCRQRCNAHADALPVSA
ncbi:MAG: hypothetical protein OXC57_00695 [Rhodobacteraceae bacterium]|nr:hypothetical protein [Paracoccaceae bacterium]